MKTALKCLAAATSLALCNIADAAIVGSLTFVEPTGTALTTDSIDVWVRLTLAPDSDTLAFDRNDLAGTFAAGGLPSVGYGANGMAAFAAYTDIMLSVGRTCTGNFTIDCSNEPYWVNQGISSWFDIQSPFVLKAGESRDFLMATMTPYNGEVAPGIYSTYRMSLALHLSGSDADGNWLGSHLQFETCAGSVDAECAFTRNVVSAVPVPAAAWLFGSGLLALAGTARRSGRR